MSMISYQMSANPLYIYLKKHYCPQCKCKMKIVYKSKYFSEKEVKPIDTSIGEVTFLGDLEIRSPWFLCPSCGKEVSIDEMRQIDKKKA